MDDDFRTKCMNVLVNKTVVHLSRYHNHCTAKYMDFIEEHEGWITYANKLRLEVILSNGEMHRFITYSEYPIWRMGRTYWLDGVLYHSGCSMEGVDDGTRT